MSCHDDDTHPPNIIDNDGAVEGASSPKRLKLSPEVEKEETVCNGEITNGGTVDGGTVVSKIPNGGLITDGDNLPLMENGEDASTEDECRTNGEGSAKENEDNSHDRARETEKDGADVREKELKKNVDKTRENAEQNGDGDVKDGNEKERIEEKEKEEKVEEKGDKKTTEQDNEQRDEDVKDGKEKEEGIEEKEKEEEVEKKGDKKTIDQDNGRRDGDIKDGKEKEERTEEKEKEEEVEDKGDKKTTEQENGRRDEDVKDGKEKEVIEEKEKEEEVEEEKEKEEEAEDKRDKKSTEHNDERRAEANVDVAQPSIVDIENEPKASPQDESETASITSSVPTPATVHPSSTNSDSEIEILSSDDEEIRKKRAEDAKANSHKAKQVLSSIKKIDLKALSSKIKLNVNNRPFFKAKIEKVCDGDYDVGTRPSTSTSDGFSPLVTSSPSCVSVSEDDEKLKEKEEAEADDESAEEESDDDDDDDERESTPAPRKRRSGPKCKTRKSDLRRQTFENGHDDSRSSTPCEDPLEREPEEKRRRQRNGHENGDGGDDDDESRRDEGLTAEGVREAALKNAAIDEEYNVKNVKNILSRLKAASLTLNTEGLRGAGDDDGADEDGVQVVEKQKKIFTEIILESSDEEEDEEDKKGDDDDDDDDVQVIANPNIKMLEQTQKQKVAEQLSSAGVVTVKSSKASKVPRQLFPKWQTVAYLSAMAPPDPVNRPVKQPPPIPKHLRRPIKVLSLFDGISGCLVALKQLDMTVDAYASAENDDFSKIVTMIRHPEATQLGDPRGVDEKTLREHGPFDLVFGGLPCDDFENDGTLRNHKAGMHFDIFVHLLKYCSRQHKKAQLSTPFHWLFYNVDLPQRHRDRISSALNCDPIKLDAIHISPMRKPDYFWSNIPDLETVLTPHPQLDRMNLQDCLEPDRVARVRRLNTFTVSFDSMQQGPYHQVPINHGGELDDLWMVEVERVLGFPNHYTDVANLPPKDRLTILAMSGSVPLFRHILTPLKRYYAQTELPDVEIIS